MLKKLKHQIILSMKDQKAKRILTIWIGPGGISDLIGPYLYEGNVNGLKYLEMLNQYVIPLPFTFI